MSTAFFFDWNGDFIDQQRAEASYGNTGNNAGYYQSWKPPEYLFGTEKHYCHKDLTDIMCNGA